MHYSALSYEARTRTPRFRHLFSGLRHDEDPGWWLKKLAEKTTAAVEVVPVDLATSPAYNFLDITFLEALLRAVRVYRFWMAHAGLLCRTYSIENLEDSEKRLPPGVFVSPEILALKDATSFLEAPSE